MCPEVARIAAAACQAPAGTPGRALRAAGLSTLVATFALVTTGAFAQGRPAPDTFTATTANMTPADVRLKIDIMNWSDAGARADAASALEADDVAAALAELPTVGYVWLSGSAVGYAVKYAHREPVAGGETVTFVTDKPLGAYGLRPWTAEGTAEAPDAGAEARAYSVVGLDLDADGNGTGTLSLAANVVIDAGAGVIALERTAAAHVLTAAKREPKPYWALSN